MAEGSNGRATRYGAIGGEAQAAANDRTLWRYIAVALCLTGDAEDKKVKHTTSVTRQKPKT